MSKKSKKWLNIRVMSVLGFFVVLFIALISRALQLQIISGDELKVLAEKQHTRSLVLRPERGLIFDRNGKELAASVMADSVYSNPSQVKDKRAVSTKLASILRANRKDISGKLSKYKNFCWIARQISPAQADRIRKSKMDGIYLVQEPKRFYPNKGLTSHVVGFVGLDSEGLEGLELKYDGYLKGEPKKVVWERDAKGNRIYRDRGATYAGRNEKDKGCNLVLTIDGKIQYIVESQLQKAVESSGARGGTSIVMNPKTGEILAMANVPFFNPNAFSKYSAGTRRNRAVTDCFDPGSVFKPFLAAAAIEEGVVLETDKFDCEDGAYVVDDRVIHEAQRKKYGELTISEILKHSSNIGMVKIAEKCGKEKFHYYIKEFGFGEKTGIDLPGESEGIVRRFQNWRDVDFTTIAFGQGISVTAIQLVSAMSAIANKGVLMKPYIVRGVMDKDGRIVKEFEPTVVRRVVSPLTAERIASIMTSVVGDEDGTGKNARIVNVSVAGKTGTSQKFDFSSGRYSSRKIVASFIGFFPAEDPQMVVYVMLDEPKKQRWGGVAAAPVFKNISEQVLRCFNSKIEIRETDEEAIDITEVVKADDLEIIPVSTDVVADGHVMPDFRGMSIREVLKISRNMGIKAKITGDGWAVKQKPEPGTPIGKYKSCCVSFGCGFR